MRPNIEPQSYDCESQELGKKLFEHLTSYNSIYDEVGNPSTTFGWYGLVIFNRIPYIVCWANNTFKYKAYQSRKAASKAWDHICNRFERWFTQNNDS